MQAKNLKFKTKILPVITTFDQNGPSVILAIQEMDIYIFEHPDINFGGGRVDDKIRYTEIILKITAQRKLQVIFNIWKYLGCVSHGIFWGVYKDDGKDGKNDTTTVKYRCNEFKLEVWF